MAILDTFYLLFESDIAGTKKDVDATEKSVDDLDKKVKTTHDSTGKLAGGFGDLVKTAAKAAIAFASIDAIIGGTFANAQRIDALGKFSKSIGESAQDVEAWGEAVARSGGSSEGFQGSLAGLAREMATVATKGESRLTPFFDKLGISLLDANGKARSTMDLLPELADKFAGLSEIESRGLGEKIGLDEGTILLLQQGRRAVEDLVARQRELGTATDEDIAKAEKFNDQWDDTKQLFRSLLVTGGSTILPLFSAILQGLESVSKFAKDNKFFVMGLFIGLAGVLAAVYMPAIIAAAVATWAAVAPFLAMGAAIAGVALLFALAFDDVMNFIKGNDSLIGRILKFVTSSGLFRAAVMGVSAAFEFLGLVVQKIIGAIERAVQLFQKVKGFVGGKFDAAVSGALEMGKDAINFTKSSPLNSQTAASVTNANRASSTNASVNIQTLKVETQATDADGISRAIGVSMKGQMRQAVAGFDDGVDR